MSIEVEFIMDKGRGMVSLPMDKGYEIHVYLYHGQ